MAEYNDFMNRMLFMPLINSGKSSVSDQQGKIVVEAYKDAFDLLVFAAKNIDLLSFSRIYWVVKNYMPTEKIKSGMKHPEMYESMSVARELFETKVQKALKENQRFCTYWRNCEQTVK